MTSRRDFAVSQPSEDAARSAEDLETAVILAQARRDCQAGLGLRGKDADAFLSRVLDDARARVAAATSKRD
ncbi:MAG: hypothetical protein J7521_01095 [Caulobacter sp.]|nr:hypothetical protein [Caulobacter sp.]